MMIVSHHHGEIQRQNSVYIINELKDENSAIHSMEVNEVHERFAPQYQLKNLKANFKRLLGNLEAKTGPFAEAKQQDAEEEEHMVEKWCTQGASAKDTHFFTTCTWNLRALGLKICRSERYGNLMLLFQTTTRK